MKIGSKRCVLHTGMKCEAVDENKSRVFGIFDRTAVGVVEDDIIFNRQSGHCGNRMKSCLNTSPLSAARFLISGKDLEAVWTPLHATHNCMVVLEINQSFENDFIITVSFLSKINVKRMMCWCFNLKCYIVGLARTASGF